MTWRYTLCVSRRWIVLGSPGSSVGGASVYWGCVLAAGFVSGPWTFSCASSLLSHPISCHISKLSHQMKTWKGPKNIYLNKKDTNSKRCIALFYALFCFFWQYEMRELPFPSFVASVWKQLCSLLAGSADEDACKQGWIVSGWSKHFNELLWVLKSAKSIFYLM